MQKQKANKYADEAQEAKKAGKPHNIGAILFFLPGLPISMANIDEASKAAKERAIHLNKLKKKKIVKFKDYISALNLS